MNRNNCIQVFEHGKLTTDDLRLKKRQLDALIKLNELHGFEYFDIIHNGIKFKQYVGVIQVDGLTIEIHPKADRNDEDGRWKGVLLQMLQACGKLKVQTIGAANVKRQHLNLLEVYFELYLAELQSLIHKGLVKKYRKDTKNVNALKGKLEFAGNIRHNLVHKERFYTTHQVYDTDHLLHQVLFEALQIVEQFSKGSSIYDKCKRTQLDFPEMKSIRVSVQELDKIKLNRKTQVYSYALEIARLIILNYSPDISGGKEKMISLLFDMNQLWEEYVLTKLRRYANEIYPNSKIIGQDSAAFWKDRGTNYSRYIKPDIVIKNGEKTFIIDTKWKRPSNQNASIEDIRQMYVYNRFWDSKKSMLLYPGNAPSSKEGIYHDKINSDDHFCHLAFVSVVKKIKYEEKESFILNDEIAKNIFDLLGEDFN